jgi:hypothetical protein
MAQVTATPMFNIALNNAEARALRDLLGEDDDVQYGHPLFDLWDKLDDAYTG